MTNWSFEHGTETRAALRSIVSDPAYGATALSNVRVMSELLPRLLRGASLERSVLVTAAKESLASTMLRHVSDGMDPVLAVRLSANFLAAISAVPIEACYWVAAELALAVGLISARAGRRARVRPLRRVAMIRPFPARRPPAEMARPTASRQGNAGKRRRPSSLAPLPRLPGPDRPPAVSTGPAAPGVTAAGRCP